MGVLREIFADSVDGPGIHGDILLPEVALTKALVEGTDSLGRRLCRDGDPPSVEEPTVANIKAAVERFRTEGGCNAQELAGRLVRLSKGQMKELMGGLMLKDSGDKAGLAARMAAGMGGEKPPEETPQPPEKSGTEATFPEGEIRPEVPGRVY